MSKAMNVLPFVKRARGNPRVWEMRENAATRRLTEEQRSEVKAAIVRHNQRYENWVLRRGAAAEARAARRAELESWLRWAGTDEIVARHGPVVVTDARIARYLPDRTSATVAELAPIYGRWRSFWLSDAVAEAILDGATFDGATTEEGKMK